MNLPDKSGVKFSLSLKNAQNAVMKKSFLINKIFHLFSNLKSIRVDFLVKMRQLYFMGAIL